MNPKAPHERVEKDLATKTIYFYIDERNGIKIKSREVYKKTNKVIFYPFGRNGQPKYENISKFVLIDMPEKLPRGFATWSRGYGFTKTLSRLIRPLAENGPEAEIIIGPKVQNKISKGKIEINSAALDREFPKFSSLFDSHNKELNSQALDSLSLLFPNNFKKPKGKYREDMLTRFIQRSGISAGDLSPADVNVILELAKEANQNDLLTNEDSVLQARERIEKFYIETVIDEFKKIYQQKNDSHGLEEKWQQFFKKYSWIFSQLFASSVLFFEDKAYVGGKSIDNKNGKVADFLYKNTLTDNIAVIEIKTHATSLIKKQAYRGTDVYAVDKELSGGINQVLDQRDNLQKEFYELQRNSKKDFETYNSKCLMVVGRLANMSKEARKAFELQRSNSKDVDIVTFDEVLEKLKTLQKIITGKIK